MICKSRSTYSSASAQVQHEGTEGIKTRVRGCGLLGQLLVSTNLVQQMHSTGFTLVPRCPHITVVQRSHSCVEPSSDHLRRSVLVMKHEIESFQQPLGLSLSTMGDESRNNG